MFKWCCENSDLTFCLGEKSNWQAIHFFKFPTEVYHNEVQWNKTGVVTGEIIGLSTADNLLSQSGYVMPFILLQITINLSPHTELKY